MILSKGGTVTVGSKPSAAGGGATDSEKSMNAASEAPSIESANEAPKSTDVVSNETKQTATTSAEISQKIEDLPKMQDEPTNNDATMQDDEVNDDDDIPELEETNEVPIDNETNHYSSNTQHLTTNRNEKKVRKIMSRLDMRPISGIVRAVMKTPGGNFVIERPDVFATNGKGAETYVIFGEARQQQPMGQMQQKKNAAAEAARVLQDTVEADTQSKANVLEGVEAGKELDTQGLEAKDIELVMSQASCEKSVAIRALKENGGDLVNAIMSLTT
jgi:nascent polypeptide-associated complex subunit alpha